MHDESSLPDEALLDQLLDRFLDDIGENRRVVTADVLPDRPELHSRIDEVWRLAQDVAIQKPNSLPAIPGYELLAELGRGGMGAVFLAFDAKLQRRVAVKVLSGAGIAGAAGRERFEREIRSHARLAHPHIVRVLNSGETDGVPWFSMDHVPGCSLATVLDRLRSHAGQAAALRSRDLLAAANLGDHGAHPAHLRETYVEAICVWIADVAEALGHAHDQGVLHRDVKPSNILIRSDGHAVLVDFGLAHLADERSLTLPGAFLGTALYAAPEQLETTAREHDGRSDVYSLGVTLYELLTLHLPFDAPTVAGLLHQVCTGETPAPRAKNPRIPRDLETIVATALQRDPRARYPGPGELAADLRRLLAFEPIHAQLASGWTRAVRWVRRHRAATVTMLMVLVLLVALPGVKVWRDAVAFESLEREHARSEALRLASLAEEALPEDPSRALGLAITAAQRCHVPESDAALQAALAACRELMVFAGQNGATLRAYVNPDERLLATTSGDGTAILWDLATRQARHKLGHGDWVSRAGFSPDSRWLVTASRDHTVRVWDTETGVPRFEPRRHSDWVYGTCFSPCGKYVLSWSRDCTAVLWDAATGAKLQSWTSDRPVINACYAAKGDRIYLLLQEHSVCMFDPASGAALHEPFPAPGAVSVDATRDGASFLISGHECGLSVYDARTGAPRFLHSQEGHSEARWSRDGRRIFSWHQYDKDVRVLDALTGKKLGSLVGHGGGVLWVDESEDGSRLATASEDGTAGTWDAATFRRQLVLRAFGPFRVKTVAFYAGSDRLASAGTDSVARIWDTRWPATERTFHVDSPCRIAGRDAAGRWLVCTQAGDLHAWRPGARPETVAEIPVDVRLAASAREGRYLQTLDMKGCARVTDLLTSTTLVKCGDATSAALSMDGSMLAVGTEDGSVRVTPVGSLSWRTVGTHATRVHSLCFHPREARLASSSTDGVTKLWDLQGSRPTLRITTPWVLSGSLAFDPKGEVLLTATGSLAQLWSATTGQPAGNLIGHEAPIVACAFSLDGALVATASVDRTVKLWDRRTAAKLSELKGHTGAVCSIAFAPEGDWVLTGGDDGTMRRWPLRPLDVALASAPRGLTLSERRRAAAFDKDEAVLLPIVDAVFQQHRLLPDVLVELARAPALDASMRAGALDLARQWSMEVHDASQEELLMHICWSLIRRPGGELEDYENALHIAEVAHAVQPSNGIWMTYHGVALYRVGRYAAAATLLDAAAKEDYQNEESLFAVRVIRGLAHRKNGDPELARRLMDRLSTAHPKGFVTDNRDVRALYDEFVAELKN